MERSDAVPAVAPGLATALLLIEGFCSLAVEMIALRMLVPVAGQSIAVTSVVVTAFLGALALGYRAGGTYRGPVRRKVAWNLAVAAVWCAFWLSHVGVRGAFAGAAFLPALGQVAVYAVVGIGPAAYLLAETVVVLVESRRGAPASAKAGSAFAASTVGNVAGGLATALLVMQYLGVAAALALVVGLLLVGVLLAPGGAGWAVRGLAVLAAVAATANAAVESAAFERTTASADYVIEDLGEGARGLRVNGQRASREDAAGIGYPYIEMMEDAVYRNLWEGGTARILVIGAGGFTFGRGRPPAAGEIVYVDVDDRLGEVGDAFLAPGSRGGRYATADGRAFLLDDESRWDAIVLDAYTDRTAMPAHLYTVEFFRLARSRLSAQGRLYLNLIARSPPGRFETRLDRTLRTVFAWCEAWPSGGGSRGRYNRVYSCGRHGLDGETVVYSDGWTLGEIDAARQRW